MATCAVHVSGFDEATATEDDIHHHMGTVGAIESIKMCTVRAGKQGKPLSTAHVYYHAADAAARACAQLDGAIMYTHAQDSCTLSVRPWLQPNHMHGVRASA